QAEDVIRDRNVTGVQTCALPISPLHGFLPFAHVDHLHPDWGIAIAAAANGLEKMEEFNRQFEHRLIWLPWQRPGFELAMMLRQAVNANKHCDGIVLRSEEHTSELQSRFDLV